MAERTVLASDAAKTVSTVCGTTREARNLRQSRQQQQHWLCTMHGVLTGSIRNPLDLQLNHRPGGCGGRSGATGSSRIQSCDIDNLCSLHTPGSGGVSRLTQAPHDSTLVGTRPHLSGCNCWLDIASLVLANRLQLL
jgi:hypothetical protein